MESKFYIHIWSLAGANSGNPVDDLLIGPWDRVESAKSWIVDNPEDIHGKDFWEILSIPVVAKGEF